MCDVNSTVYKITFVSSQSNGQCRMNGCVPLIDREMDRICTPIKQNLKYF